MERISSPRTGDDAIEQEIKAKGLTAARVTPADIEANIASEHYFTGQDGVEGAFDKLALHQVHHDTDTTRMQAPPPAYQALRLLTFCVLVLRNGFTVTGESAWVSPENFDADVGRKVARQNAINKWWLLMDYERRSRMAEETRAYAVALATEA